MNKTDNITLLRGESKNDSLQKKVYFAIRLLRSIPTDEQPVEISYSGGKDSDVILELAKMAGIPYRAIYKNTTIDPPCTIRHCKEKGVEVFAPSYDEDNGLITCGNAILSGKLPTSEYEIIEAL